MSTEKSTLRRTESTLSAIVLLIATVILTDLPEPYPAWPTLGSIPVNPELVVPGLLGLVVLVGVAADGLSVESAVLGITSCFVLGMAATSLYTLYAGTAGGVFAGGLFTLAIGVPLAVAVLARNVARKFTFEGVAAGIRTRLNKP